MSDENEFQPPSFGWVDRPEDVAAACAALEEFQQAPIALFGQAPELKGVVGETAPVFAWRAERAALGKVLPPLDQGQDGQCVSFGWARAIQDLLLAEICSGSAETWPGLIATEPIYAGSRVEVGGGKINGAGSVGAWAAEWVRKWGVVARQVYGKHDLTEYSMPRGKAWGNTGCPDDLEPEAKLHPVSAVALVTRGDEAWAALGGWKPIPVCSQQGFTTKRDKDGFCSPSGSWAHCMTFRGRFVHPRRGKAAVCANSWGDYLGRSNETFEFKNDDGTVGTETLPGGCFCVEWDVVERMLSVRDSFTIAGLSGWAPLEVSYVP